MLMYPQRETSGEQSLFRSFSQPETIHTKMMIEKVYKGNLRMGWAMLTTWS